MSDNSVSGSGREGGSVEGETALRPDLDKSFDFLRQYRPDGPWVLTAIPAAKGPTKTVTFRPGGEPRMGDWIQRFNLDRHHIYFMVNTPMHDLDKKASKEDVRDMIALHVDIDPRKGEDPAAARTAAIARLETYRRGPEWLKPSIVIDSGGGVQALWLLDKPLPIDGHLTAAEGAELYNHQLIADLEGDGSCFNIDRILRLPGTINWKDGGGRKPRLAALLDSTDFCLSSEHLAQIAA